jgi:MCP family monocarboxylic acid transporter-like MFS transporter 10
MQLIFLIIATLLIRPRLPRQRNEPLFLPIIFFSHPAYTSLIISSVLFSWAYPVFLILCGQYALDIGAGKAAPYVLIACNAASGVERVTSGVIADKWGYHNVMIIGLIGSTVVMFSWMAIGDCNGLIGAAVAYGLLTGGNIALQGPCVVTLTKDVGSPGTLIGQMFGW